MSLRSWFRLQHAALLLFLAIDVMALVAFVVYQWWLPSGLVAWGVGIVAALALLPAELWLVNKVFAGLAASSARRARQS